MAENEDTPDLSFIPDDFKGEDGAYDLAGYAAHVDGLTSYKQTAEEATAALPQSADGYVFGVADDFAFPDGFDASQFPQPVLGEDGKPKVGADGQPETRDLLPADLIDPEDPDIPVLQELMLANGAKPEMMAGLAGIMVQRELRQMAEAGEAAAAEKKALGPDAENRLSVVTRSVQGALPAAEAKAILDGITTADGLRAIEKLVGRSSRPPAPAQKSGADLDSMSPREMIQLGLKQQSNG